MLVGAAADVGGDAGIEDAVGAVGHDVNPAAGHWGITAWMAGTRPAMTAFGLDQPFERDLSLFDLCFPANNSAIEISSSTSV
jgi:hypothetical protein